MNTNDTIQAEIEANKARIAELQAQADELARQAREMEQKKKDEEARIKREEERKASLLEWSGVAAQMVEALKVIGFNQACWKAPKNEYDSLPDFSVLGEGVYNHDFGLELEPVLAGRHNYGRSYISGYRITVGSYGNKKTFPQLKTGQFSYAKIAEEVQSRYIAHTQEEQRRKAKESLKSRNLGIVRSLAAELDPSEKDVKTLTYWSEYHIGMTVTPSETSKGKVNVELKNTMTLTEGQTVELFTLLTKIRKENEVKK